MQSMIESLPHFPQKRGLTRPHPRTLSKVRHLVAFLFMTGCAAPEYRYSVDITSSEDDRLYHESERLYQRLYEFDDEVSHSAGFETPELISTDKAKTYSEYSQSLLLQKQNDSRLQELIEHHSSSADSNQAARDRSRLEIAYCQHNPNVYQSMMTQWQEYKRDETEKMMRMRCSVLYQSHAVIIPRTLEQITKLPEDLSEQNLVDQVTLLSQRLEEIEYAYLLSTMVKHPHADEDRERMMKFEELQMIAESQLQKTMNELVSSGHFPIRRPQLIPYNR